MQQIKRQLKFVRLLRKNPTQTHLGTSIRIESSNERASLDVQTVKALISQGVLRAEKGVVFATKEAPNWIRRKKLSMGESAALVGMPPIERSPNYSDLPIVGNGQLNRLCGRKNQTSFLTPDHILAANRLEKLIEKAMLTPRITRDYASLGVSLGQGSKGQASDISDMAADARKQLATLYCLLPSDCMGVLVDICGFSKGLQDIEASRNWPRRSAKLVAKIGLDQLGAIWGIGELGTAPKRAKA